MLNSSIVGALTPLAPVLVHLRVVVPTKPLEAGQSLRLNVKVDVVLVPIACERPIGEHNESALREPGRDFQILHRLK